MIEDDRSLGFDLARGLERKGWLVTGAADLAAARAALDAAGFDIVLLDLGLPDGDGARLMDTLRHWPPGLVPPVIVLTARGALESRLALFRAGVDDYLVKPFAIDELDARMNAVMRRVGEGASRLLAAGNVCLDVVTRAVSVNGRHAGCTPREADALELLIRGAGQVIARRAAIEALFGSEGAAENALDVVMSRLRRRLADAGADIRVHTLKGIGFLLERPR